MTIRKTSKPCIGGATPKRDRADREIVDRSVNRIVAGIIMGTWNVASKLQLKPTIWTRG